MAFTDWLYNLIAKRRGWPMASEMQVLSGTPIQKSIEEYAQLAVAPSGARSQEPAPWQHDRNEFVKHYKNSVYVAVGAIARKIATQKVIVSRRTIDEQGEKLEPVGHDHPLQQLFMEVNPRDTQWDLWFYTAAWRLVVGESYWWKARNGFGLPKELWHLPPQWVHAIPSETQYIDGYRVEGVFGKEPVEIPSDDVVHLREPSLDWSGTGRYYGTPALAAAATPVDLEDAMYKRLYHSFKNYAPPAEKFVTDQELTKQQVMEVYRQVMSQHRAAEHTGRPMILHSGLKPVGGMMPQEMSYQESLETTMDSILSIFGVPKAVVGLVSDTNRANMEAALESFCQNTINPMLEHIGQHLTQGLAREFEPDLVVHFKPCTVGDTKALHDAWRLANSAHAVTADEIRDELLGKGPLSSGGDVVRNRTGEPIGAGNVDDDELFAEPEIDESAEAVEPDDADEADVEDDATQKASYKPTAGMKAEAAKGLAWRKEHNRGGTAVGVARARDITNDRELSLDTVKRMHSFFARHEVDKKGKGFSPGEDGFPSAGRIAWALWGGDAGQSWARKITQSVDKASEIDPDAEQVKDIADVLAERQIAKYEADAMKVVTEAIAEALVDDPPTNGHAVNGSANRLSRMMGEG
jgi:HK97 family phage portal protein